MAATINNTDRLTDTCSLEKFTPVQSCESEASVHTGELTLKTFCQEKRGIHPSHYCPINAPANKISTTLNQSLKLVIYHLMYYQFPPIKTRILSLNNRPQGSINQAKCNHKFDVFTDFYRQIYQMLIKLQ